MTNKFSFSYELLQNFGTTEFQYDHHNSFTGPYLGPATSSLQLTSLKSILTLSSHIFLDVSTDLFKQAYPTSHLCFFFHNFEEV
jgi:hypothetical protein